VLDKLVERIALQPYGYYAAKFKLYPAQHRTELAILEHEKLEIWQLIVEIGQEKLAASVPTEHGQKSAADPAPTETPAAAPLAAEPHHELPPFALTSPCFESRTGCKHESKLLTPEESLAFFDELFTLPWKQHNPNRGPAPRMVAWMGVPPNPNSYTGRTPIVGGGTLKPIAWTPAALAIKKKVEEVTGETFDCLNLNLYRHNRDYCDWHSDDADEGLWTASIASVSLGATRTFQVRHDKDNEIIPLDVVSGSLVVMPPGFQRDWLHRLAKTTTPSGPRINLTFRRMMPTAKDLVGAA
jgi:alkylated DNA repair dioxygenase AlkB